MKIFITGSESFVAKELIKQCLEAGMKVVGVDLVPAKSQEYEFHSADIGSLDVSELIPEGADAIIHLAALSRDPDCNGRAYECFQANVMGTLNLMNAAAKKNVKQFIFASSEWVYDRFKGNEEKNEDAVIDIAKHTSEYALSKLVSEANFRQRFQQGFYPTTLLRFAIIYGPRKNNWSAVESIASSVKNQGEVTVGSKQTGRRFIHVSDIARGIIKSIGLQGFNIINLSANRVFTLGEIAETTAKILGKPVKVIESNPTAFNLRNPSNRRAKELIGWEPQLDLEAGLKTLLPFV